MACNNLNVDMYSNSELERMQLVCGDYTYITLTEQKIIIISVTIVLGFMVIIAVVCFVIIRKKRMQRRLRL